MRTAMLIHPEELTRSWIDRLVDARIDTLGIHPSGGRGAAQSLNELIEYMQTKEYRALIDYARNRGLTVEYELHAAGYLMPRAWFAEHPEYFRMDENGNRTDDWNFCVTNREALALYASRAADLAEALYGSNHNFYFWMGDKHGCSCQCPNCKIYSPSDQQLIAINSALREIKKRIPKARMAYLAYKDTIVPPQAVKPDAGVFLEYAPFEKYTAKGENAPALIAREKEMLKLLMDCFKQEPPKVLEYWYDNSLYSEWKRPPKKFTLKEAEMRADITEYCKTGFAEIATFACFLGDDYIELYGDVDIRSFQIAMNDAIHADPSQSAFEAT